MAGNFWQSSHYSQWLWDRAELNRARAEDLKNLSEEEYHKIMVFFCNFIQHLGEKVPVRQQVIATASVHMRRFYAKCPLRSIDPLLLAPTCLLLASKVDEFGLISHNKVLTAAQSLISTKLRAAFPHDYPYRTQQIGEAEFYLLEMLDCCLIVYHPYRPLMQFIQDMGMSADANNEILALAWKLCNDSLRTDVSLLYPPHIIALACLHISCVSCNNNIGQNQNNGEKNQAKMYNAWFAELAVDILKVFECEKHILSLFQMFKEAKSDHEEQKEIASLLQRIKNGPNSNSASNKQFV